MSERDNWGSLLMALAEMPVSDCRGLDHGVHIPSLGSATARDAFFSSLIASSMPASVGVTFPSTIAALCSRAAQVR